MDDKKRSNLFPWNWKHNFWIWVQDYPILKWLYVIICGSCAIGCFILMLISIFTACDTSNKQMYEPREIQPTSEYSYRMQ